MIEHGDVTINSLGISIGHIEQSITDKGEPGFSSWDSFHCQFLTTILSMFNYSGGRKKKHEADKAVHVDELASNKSLLLYCHEWQF